MRRAGGLLWLGLLLVAAAAFGVEPKKQDALVYRLRSYTIEEYATVYSPPQADTIYLVAGVDNVCEPRYTQVYYWPLSQEYFASWESLDVEAAGTLEVLMGGRVLQRLERRPVAFQSYGAAGGRPVLASGGEALALYDRYQAESDRHEKELAKYSESLIRYRQALRDYMRRSRQPAGAGEPPVEPKEPAPLDWYVSAPYGAFVLNLPAGEYRIRLRDEQGEIVEGSERRLEAFAPTGPEGVGYELFSESRWTAAVRSDSAENDIYCSPGAELYLVAHRTEQFFEDCYLKVTNPQAGEVPRRVLHVYGEALPQAVLVVSARNESGRGAAAGTGRRIEAKPYYVQQLQGADLGYRILEWSPELAGKDSPTFVGYHLTGQELKGAAAFEVALEEPGTGARLPGSRRLLRIGRERLALIVWLLPLLPLAAAVGVLVPRAGRGGKLDS
jgi:hypothetical protein